MPRYDAIDFWSALDGAYLLISKLHHLVDEGKLDFEDLTTKTDIQKLVYTLDEVSETLENLNLFD